MTRRLLKDEAYVVLRDAIVSGELAPGETLSEADLAARLGFSRAPVRSALARLIDDGLVETKPQSFTRVTAVVDVEVRDAAQVVRSMHELVVRLAVPRLTDADVTAMVSANDRFTRAVGAGDVEEALLADDEFHDVPVRVAANQAAAATIERFTPLIRRLERAKFTEVPGRESVQLHAQLMAAFRARDIEHAVAITTRIWSALEQQLDAGAARTPSDDPSVTRLPTRTEDRR